VSSIHLRGKRKNNNNNERGDYDEHYKKTSTKP